MKKNLYKIINKLGYRIEKKRSRQELFPSLNKYNAGKNYDLLFNSKTHIINLEKVFSDFSLKKHENGFIASFLDLKIYVESPEEFLILNEVFVSTDYQFLTKEKTVVIDVGANIGISALFFSKLDYVDAIYAFEPVLDTYNQANFNFDLNKSIHKVKKINNKGLGDSTREDVFLYNKFSKGNTGSRGVLSPSYSKEMDNEERKVIISEASKEIEEIINKELGKKIFLKMDCEGGEYEILENLKKTGVLHKIDIIILEWHDKGAEVIEQTLLDFDFKVFSRDLGPISGIISASK